MLYFISVVVLLVNLLAIVVVPITFYLSRRRVPLYVVLIMICTMGIAGVLMVSSY